VRAVDERRLVGELDALQGAADVPFLHHLEAAVQVAPQDEREGGAQADQHADQEVRHDDRDDGDHERQELRPALPPHAHGDLGARELEARDDEHGGERGERHSIDQLGEEHDRHDEQHTVPDRRQPRAGARVDVDRAADDDRRHRQGAREAGEHVADALREQLAVRRRHALVRVELVGRLEVQQRLERGDDAERQRREQHFGVEQARPVGRIEHARPADAVLADHRDLDEVLAGDEPVRPRGAEDLVDHGADQHRDQGARHDRLLERRAVPDDEQRQRNEADQGRTRQQAAQRRADRAERVVAVRLRERHLAFEVLVVPDQVRELLEDQQHADRRQEPTDDAVREEVRQAASLHETEHDLQHAGQEDRGEERLEAAEPLDLRQHDRRETGRGTRDADVRTAQRTDDDAADDARQQARLQRRARGERDAEAQWDRDEEDDEARGEVAREALRQRQVLPVVRARSIRSGGAHGAQSRDGARQHAQAEPFINSVGFAAKRLRRTT
jgi:hypothetical protein